MRFLRFIPIFVALFSVFFLSACQQKPQRPTPDQTVMGPGPGSLDFSPADARFADDSLGLADRDGRSGPDRQIRDVLESVYFDFDRSNIRENERSKLQDAARYLRENPQHRLLIEGHCDWRGTTEYNLGLGDRRAAAAKDFLVSLGIDSDRIETLSKGDLEAAVGGSDQEMARDRRAELVVLR